MSPSHLWSSCGCLSFIALLAGCSNDTVNLGGGREPRVLQSGERCSGGASIVQGPVTVHDQGELEQLAGCEQIDGDLHIEVFEGADLRPLSALRVVDGLLEIGAYPDAADQEQSDLGEIRSRVDGIVRDGYLSSLTGLEGLQRASTLQLSYIAAADLEPLLGLRQLSGRASDLPAGSLYVEHAGNLRDLRGLSNIESVQEVVLAYNPALTNLGEIQLSPKAANVTLVGSPLLSSISELARITSATTVTLSDLGITDIDSLVNLSYVEYNIIVDSNESLQNLGGLANVSSAAGFTVTNNRVLESITGLHGRPFEVDTLMVYNNPKLQSLHLDLPAKVLGGESLQGSPVPNPVKLINIGNNASLTELSLSAGLESGRVIAVYENPALVQLSIGTLRTMDELHITGNASLEHVDVGALETVDELSLIDNPKLDPAQLGKVRTFTSIVGRNATSP
ncbi:MAG TPA: hypothetical protein VFS67_35305 [Polyangiaceae bacterium]|nr:hypothetical protein [Polyangiaceae bacterium]